MIKRGNGGGKERKANRRETENGREEKRRKWSKRSNRMEVNQIISQIFDTKPLVRLHVDRVFLCENRRTK